MTVQTLRNEIRKSLIISWSYRLNFLMDIAIFSLIFLLLSFLMGDGDVARFESRASYLMGWLVSTYGFAALSGMGYGIREEAVTGTFEQMMMSPSSALVLLTGRALANLIVHTLSVTISAILLVLALDIDFPLRLQGLPAFALTLAGLYAFGFVIAGLTIVFKRVEMIANMLANFLLLLNGTFVGVDKFAPWLADLTRLLPTTQGLIVMRRVVLDHESLSAVWQDGSLITLALNSLAFLAAGVAIYLWAERVAKRRGSLAQY